MWKICIDADKVFQNVELIFPTQQADVSKIVSDFSKIKNVEKIIVFGSSVTSACNPWSDIDLFVQVNEEIRLKKPRVGVPIDLWTNFDIDENLMREINETGVVVYAR